MADYIRFEIYIPRIYNSDALEDEQADKTVSSLDPVLVQTFIDETVRNFGGVSEANPHAPTPYKGWWHSASEDKVVVDAMTYLLVLVRIDQSDAAIAHFSEWKARFEAATNQDVILIAYYPVQVLGGFI